MDKYLVSDSFFNYEHPLINEISAGITGNSAREKAVQIYYVARDRFPYDPFIFIEGVSSLGSDYCVDHGKGYCISKAAFQVALSRSIGIPARIGFADVKNHLSTSKLDELLQNDIFSMHGYVEQWIENHWVKSTPAFNQSLCTRFGLQPLEFDGITDSIFHPFTQDGSKHMEYLADHGTFAEMPVDLIRENVALHYPHLLKHFQ